jgi:hypothetical protein
MKFSEGARIACVRALCQKLPSISRQATIGLHLYQRRCTDVFALDTTVEHGANKRLKAISLHRGRFAPSRLHQISVKLDLLSKPIANSLLALPVHD